MNAKIVKRRAILRSTGLLTAGLLLGAPAAPSFAASTVDAGRRLTPDQAWAALRQGNRRWASGEVLHPHQDRARRTEVAKKQEPYAVVVSCIDSRVPPEIVFDTGLGDLLTVRSAAHTIDPLVSGAIEYGPFELDVPLIVVLGHQRCGAVGAAAHALDEGERLPGSLHDIVEALRPAYKRADGNVEKMIRLNTTAVVAELKAEKLLRRRIARKQLKIVGGYYSLDTGLVTRLV
ncbi:carbonic anhydrase [Nonomuraea sp. K274]|uniref:Carbonic anhydrase n=1 Tax=Nonomuraea cypriaca TaxID=1187855 RepID=A0A931AHF5_9ACTN|nr:carbonic anhydrase [Nonomuraea cypriaca]MBF8192746.1 carbonic anhydrase [Nonomuraea cypriaca]